MPQNPSTDDRHRSTRDASDEDDDGKQPQQEEEEKKGKSDEEREEDEIHEKSAASAHIVYRAILMEAQEELERHSRALAWSGLAAGMSMGFTLVLEGLIQSHLPEANWSKLVANLGYTVGFVILILSRQQLFTENTLTPILALLRRKTKQNLFNTARLWAILLATNLLGGLIIAYALNRSTAFTEHERETFMKIASEALEPTRGTLFVKSIFAGWLIAIMVWMLPVAETSRIWVLIIIPYIVGLGGLSHIIIGSIYCFYTIFGHHHTFGEYFTHFFWPVLLGNCLGGVTLVAVVNYGQATAGKEP